MAVVAFAEGTTHPTRIAASPDIRDPMYLQSLDGETLEIPRLPAYSSIEQLEDEPGAAVPVPFDAALLRRVIGFWEQGRLAASSTSRRGCAKASDQSHGLGCLKVEEPLRSAALLESGFPLWACAFVDLPPEEVEPLLWAVDFLGCEDLLSACLARIATVFLDLDEAPPLVSARALRHLLERRPGYLPVHAWPAALDALIAQAPPGDEDVVRVLVGLLASAEWQLRAAAKHALQLYSWRGHEPTLDNALALFAHPMAGVRQVAAEVVEVVAPRSHPAAVQAIIALVHDGDSEVRRAATRALAAVAETGDKCAIEALLGVQLGGGSDERLADIAEALGHIACRGDERVIARLLELLEEERWWTRLAALHALAIVASPADSQKVEHLLEMKDGVLWSLRPDEALAFLGVPPPPDSEPLDPEDIYTRAAALQAVCEELAANSEARVS